MNVILLGTAPSSIQLAPFANPEWEIWSCSPGTYGAPRHDRFFELHRWEPHQTWFSEGYMQFLRDFPGEVVMSEHVPEVKNCVLLPWRELVAKYGPYFFTSSLAWMMAMAIEAGAKKIALYGVDMAANTEYHDQRMGCQYFALMAAARGIEVGVPPESDLFRPAPLYGVCETSHAWIKQRARNIELNSRLTDASERAKTALEEIHFIKGALDDQDWNLHSWFGGVDTQGKEFTTVPHVPALFGLRDQGIGTVGGTVYLDDVDPYRFNTTPPQPAAKKAPRKAAKKTRGRPRKA